MTCPDCGYVGESITVWHHFVVDKMGNSVDFIAGKECPECGWEDDEE